jgi:signal transduction histidine kinase/HAMP domain-containing protein
MFLIIALVPTLMVVFFAFDNFKHALETSEIRHLQDVLSFKNELLNAYFDRLKTHVIIAHERYFIRRDIHLLTEEPNSSKAQSSKKIIDEQMKSTQSALNKLYLSDILIVSLEGKVLYAIRAKHHFAEMSKNNEIQQQAFEEGKKGIYFSDVYFDEFYDKRYEMMLTAPIYDFNNIVAGVLVFEVDMQGAYDIVQQSTAMGKTGESFVAKKIGDEFVYLSPLKLEPNVVLNKKFRISGDLAIPMQRAVQGKTGAGVETDYRGEKVIAAWTYLPELDWGMVAKIDTSEAFETVAFVRNLILIIIFAVLGITGLLVIYIANIISKPIKKLLKGVEIVGTGNLDYKVANKQKDEIGRLSRAFDMMTTYLKETTASRNELNNEIIERKKKEEELQKVNRTLRALTDSNQAMMHAEEEESFLQQICWIVTKDCGYSMVTINYAMNDKEKSVQTVAYAGFQKDYVENLKLSWADDEYGQGPTGIAIRTRKAVVSNDILKDPYYTPWRELALRSGFLSAMAIPLIVGDKTLGTMNVYSNMRESFSDDEVMLFSELGNDLAAGITVIRARRELEINHEELKRLNQELARSNQELEHFANIISHDLREPLRGVSGFAELLQIKNKGNLDDKSAGFLNLIVASAKNMQNMIKGLIEYSRVQSRGQSFTRIDTNKVLKSAIDNLTTSITESKAEITNDNLPLVNADESQLIRLFQNLIHNAIKFRSEKNPKIHIGCKRGENEWLFWISDNGIGMSRDFQKRAFTIFQREHKKERPGDGVGLAVCRKIAERHNGKIWFESEEKKGSTFYFTIHD